MASGSDDAAERPPHVKQVKGRWYWDPPDRLRKSHKLRTIALGGNQAAAWAHARMLNRDHLSLGPDAPVVGTVGWLFEAFIADDKFKALAAATQRDYKWLARRVLGPLDVAGRPLSSYGVARIRPAHADAIYGLIVQSHGAAAAHYACRVARRVWHWGLRREIAQQNPWTGMELKSIPARTQLWTPAQVEAVREKAIATGAPSIALAVSLAYWLGHRQGDVLSLTWSAIDAGVVTTRKTGRVLAVSIDAYPALAAELAAERARQKLSGVASTHVVVCEATKRPWERHGFGHAFREVARAAGLPDDLQYRDLRATAGTELSDAGADVIGISTHLGHKTVTMARRYVRPTAEGVTAAANMRMARRKNI